MGRGLVAAVAASLLMSVMADCSKSSKVVRSSNAWATGYDEWCGAVCPHFKAPKCVRAPESRTHDTGHGDPCACERGRMKKKSGTSTMHEGRSYDEYYCCTAECDDSKCTSPDGKGGTDCDVAATVGERFTCAAGWTPQRLNFKPAYDILGLPLYKYSCCRWPDGKEPELPNEAAIGAIIAGVVGGLVGTFQCGEMCHHKTTP